MAHGARIAAVAPGRTAPCWRAPGESEVPFTPALVVRFSTSYMDLTTEILRIPASKPFCWNRPVSRFREDILLVTQARVPGRLATNGPGCPVKAVRIHLRTAWYLWRYVSGGGQPVSDFNAAGGRATVISPEGGAEEQTGHPADAGPTAARGGPGPDSQRHLTPQHGRCAGSLCLYGYLIQSEDTPDRVRSHTPSGRLGGPRVAAAGPRSWNRTMRSWNRTMPGTSAVFNRMAGGGWLAC